MAPAPARAAQPTQAPPPPGPRQRYPFSHLVDFRADPIGSLGERVRQYGDIVRFAGPLLDFVHLNHPDHVKHVLQDRHALYEKDLSYDRLRPVVGEGLLTSRGAFWRRQRRLAQPAFHKQRLAGFAAVMVQETTAMLDAWRAAGDRPVDLSAEMMRLALAIVGKTMFGADLARASAVVHAHLPFLLQVTHERINSLLVLPWLPTPRNLRFTRGVRALDAVVQEIIDARRAAREDPGDLLSMLMQARDEETGEAMDDRQLRDEVMTMFLAGHETTANALTWAWVLLAREPEVTQRLEAEVDAVLGGRAPAVEDLPRLRYARAVIDETLRLRPPAWIYSREALEDDVIGGYAIAKGTIVSICPYLLHRHPSFWEEPERFDPDRWRPERAEARPRFAYVPFAAGPRQCIGNGFALMEATLVLALVTQRYCVRPEAREVELHPSITLRPRGEVRVQLEPRVAARAARS